MRTLWLCLGLVFQALMYPASADEKRFALLIGNQAYPPTVGSLGNPIQDVGLIRSALLKVGFSPEHVLLLPDVGRIAILSAFDQFTSQLNSAGAGAIGFVYYSGHGASKEDKTDYLIPVDVPNILDSHFWYYAVPLQDLVDKLNRDAPLASHFVVFDACRNTLALADPQHKSVGQKGFEPVSVPGGMLIAFATAPGALASDVGSASGPYARILAEEIVRPGVEAATMFHNVQIRVFNDTGQKPWLEQELFKFVFFAGSSSTSAEDSSTAGRSRVGENSVDALLHNM
jgi:uncharacterized caspase-like protein